MGQPNYRVVLTGNTTADVKREAAITTAAKIFHCSEDKASQLLSGKPTPLKKEMDEGTAQRYQERLLKAGIACRIEVINAAARVAEKLASNLSLEPMAGETQPESSASASPALQHAAPGTQRAQASTGFHCPKCLTPQEKGVECIKCGIIFAKYQAPTQPALQTEASADEAASDEWDEICLFVGENIDAYRFKFRGIYDNDGKFAVHWHWPAFLIPVPWMIYRKMYLWAAAYALIMAFSPLVLMLPVILVPGLVGNFLYYRHAVQQIGKIQSHGEQRRRDIEQAGGNNSVLVTIGISILASLVMSFIMYKMIVAPYLGKAMESVKQDVNFLEGDKNPGVQPTKVKMLMLKSAAQMQERLIKNDPSGGRMPTDMDELLETLHSDAGAADDAWKTPMTFEYDNGQMTFTSAGPDKLFNTADDIVLQ